MDMFGIYLTIGIVVFVAIWIYGERWLIHRQQCRSQVRH